MSTGFVSGLNGGGSSVFWSGYKYKARETAMSVGTTIDKTPVGGLMNYLHYEKGLDLGERAWKVASGIFARNAKGTARAVLRDNNAKTVWFEIEKPILENRNVPIKYID